MTHCVRRLTSTPVGQLLRGKPLQLRKTAGVAEVQRAVNASLDAEIPLVDSHGLHTITAMSILHLGS